MSQPCYTVRNIKIYYKRNDEVILVVVHFHMKSGTKFLVCFHIFLKSKWSEMVDNLNDFIQNTNITIRWLQFTIFHIKFPGQNWVNFNHFQLISQLLHPYLELGPRNCLLITTDVHMSSCDTEGMYVARNSFCSSICFCIFLISSCWTLFACSCFFRFSISSSLVVFNWIYLYL